MNIFRDERWRRVLRPVLTLAAFLAALWHTTHILAMWQQSRQYRASEPDLADYFMNAMMVEIGTTFISVMAGVFAWHFFKPKRPAA